MAPLKARQKVAVVAPGGWAPVADLKKSLRLLEGWGLQPFVHPKILKKSGSFAADLSVRQSALVLALQDPEIKAVFCLRGGYGTAMTVEALRGKPLRRKWVVGMSDISVLHAFLNKKGWPTLHAPVLTRIIEKPREAEEVRQILFGEKQECLLKGAWLHKLRGSQPIQAPVVGGNLRTLEAGVGTFWEVRAKGCFLFLEDINEKGYQVHRALWHMYQAGLFKDIKGLLFGDFVGGDRKVWPFVRQFLRESGLAQANVPVLKGLRVGHGAVQKALPFRTEALVSPSGECKAKCPAQKC